MILLERVQRALAALLAAFLEGAQGLGKAALLDVEEGEGAIGRAIEIGIADRRRLEQRLFGFVIQEGVEGGPAEVGPQAGA